MRGDRSSTVRASGCGPDGWRFESARSPTFVVKKHTRIILLGALIIVLIILDGIAKSSITIGASTKNNAKITKVISKKTAIPKPTVKPKPSSTPSPTPTPNYGYCLYVPVILYHHIQPQTEAVANKQTSLSVDNGYFDQQMGYLVSHGYTTITSQQLVDAVRGHTGVPPKSIVVTIDDGYADQYNYLFPVIKKYNVKVSLMIPSGLIGNPGFMTWDQVREMAGSGLVSLIDHTWSHYPIQSGTYDKIKFEIETGKSVLEQNTGQRIDLFAYPYGSFNNASISILQQDGFLGAFSTIGGSYQCDSFIMTLHRNHIGNAPLSAYGL